MEKTYQILEKLSLKGKITEKIEFMFGIKFILILPLIIMSLDMDMYNCVLRSKGET